MARQSIQNANASLYLPNGSFSSSTAIAGLSAGFTFGCWFKITTINAVCRIITNGEAASAAIATMGINGANGNSALRAGYYNGSSYIGTRSSSMLSPGQWYHGVYTFDGTNGNIYINGALDNVTGTNQPSGSNNSSLRIGDGTSGLRGNVSKAVVYNRAVTAEEVASIYAGNIPTSGLQANYPLSEGAGTIAYDTSGNGNNGTITSGTWTRETPSKTRKTVNNNLVYNGDFEIAPVVNVAQTTVYRFLDGTATGVVTTGQANSTNRVFGVYFFNELGSGSIMLDNTEKYSGNYSLKVSTLATASYANAAIGYNNVDDYIPVLPSTTYTVSYWMKTNYISGDGSGANVTTLTLTGNKTLVSFVGPTGIKTTTDWTYYTTTVTTGATARYISVLPWVSGNTGTGTLIMDAWFDDITLTPTTDTTRTVNTGPYRKTVENLVTNGDFEYAPAFTAATNTANRYIDGTAAGLNANESPYKWFAPSSFANATAQYDTSVELTGTASMKLSTTTTAGLASAIYGNNTSTTNIKLTMIPVLPSTSYTVSGYCKTNNVAAAAAHIDIYEYNGACTLGATNTTNTLTGTNDWTLVTVTFTTASTARYLTLALRNHVAGNISDAYFDDIKLTKTTPDARSVA
jgi:hypothetical protein